MTAGGLHDSLALVNAARGGADAIEWTSPSSSVYDEADQELGEFELTPEDVQVVWIKQANSKPDISLPDPDADAFTLLRHLGSIARALKERYPNLRQAYVSSRIWACTDGGINGEPFAYEGGFAVKWLVEAQIVQLETGQIDPVAGDLGLDVAPWLAWGPYLWADGQNPRSDGLTWSPADLENDCIHPSSSGEEKVGTLLLDFFSHSPVTTGWFLK